MIDIDALTPIGCSDEGFPGNLRSHIFFASCSGLFLLKKSRVKQLQDLGKRPAKNLPPTSNSPPSLTVTADPVPLKLQKTSPVDRRHPPAMSTELLFDWAKYPTYSAAFDTMPPTISSRLPDEYSFPVPAPFAPPT